MKRARNPGPVSNLRFRSREPLRPALRARPWLLWHRERLSRPWRPALPWPHVRPSTHGLRPTCCWKPPSWLLPPSASPSSPPSRITSPFGSVRTYRRTLSPKVCGSCAARHGPAVTLVTAVRVTAITLRRSAACLCQLGKIDRVGARSARSAIQSILHDEDLRDVVSRSKQLEDERVGLHVVLAKPPTAEATRPHRGLPAMPAIHRQSSRSKPSARRSCRAFDWSSSFLV